METPKFVVSWAEVCVVWAPHCGWHLKSRLGVAQGEPCGHKFIICVSALTLGS